MQHFHQLVNYTLYKGRVIRCCIDQERYVLVVISHQMHSWFAEVFCYLYNADKYDQKKNKFIHNHNTEIVGVQVEQFRNQFHIWTCYQTFDELTNPIDFNAWKMYRLLWHSKKIPQFENKISETIIQFFGLSFERIRQLQHQ